MKIYYYLKDTPMRFHRFFWLVATFLDVYFMSKALGVYPDVIYVKWTHHVDFLFYFSSAVLLLVASTGLQKLSTWGWLSTMAFCLNLAQYSIYRIFRGIFHLSLPFSDLLLPIFCLICAIVVALYYYPRRPLFLVGITFHKWSKKDTIFAPFFANRCRYCCHKYHPEDTDCPKCGRYIIPGL